MKKIMAMLTIILVCIIGAPNTASADIRDQDRYFENMALWENLGNNYVPTWRPKIYEDRTWGYVKPTSFSSVPSQQADFWIQSSWHNDRVSFITTAGLNYWYTMNYRNGYVVPKDTSVRLGMETVTYTTHVGYVSGWVDYE